MDQRKLPTIFDHFVLPEDLERTFRGKCRPCTKTISGTIEVTTNWLKHMVSGLTYSKPGLFR